MTDQTSETTPDGLDVAGVRLREDERETLAAALQDEVDHSATCTCCPGLIDDLAPTFERIIAARVAEAGARAWDEAVRECHDLGWLHDYARSDAIERNPYRARGLGGAS